MSDEIRELKEKAESSKTLFLQADGQGKGIVCPKCGSGSGRKGTGMRLVPNDPDQHYHCFACGNHADIIDLIGQTQTNSNDPKEITRAGAEYIRKTLGIKPQAKNTHYAQNVYDTHNTANTHNEPAGKTPVKDIAAQQAIKKTIQEAEKHIAETDYMTKRGISEKTLKRFHIGYDPNWKYPGRPNNKPEPRIIIPLSEYSYTARTLKNESTAKYIKVGDNELLNTDALFDYTQPCFITEGEINALSIIEVGYNACALGSANNISKLENALKEKTPTHLILYLDSDKAGQECDTKLQSQLSALGVAYTSITGEHTDDNDPNDFLVRSKGDFIEYLAKAQEKAKQALETEKNDYIRANNAAGYVDDFLSDIDNRAKTPCTPTGFRQFDKVLDGGFYEGLYILGAISSAGKTTFALQVADQIAKSGQDVLFYSLEQSRHELIGKSLSRETALISEQWGVNKAKKYRDITNPERHKNFEADDFEIMAQAISRYKEKAQHLYIFEGLGDIGVKDIRETVERHIRATGNTPIIFIDYLQIMKAPDDKNRTDKQILDINISDLKRLSRDLKLTIFGISSFNRESYTASVNMAAFKESGAIEYSSDVLIGLQFADIDYSKQSDTGRQSIRDQLETEKQKDPRAIKLVILKNRNGALGDVEYNYFPAYHRYEEKIKF